MSYAPKVLRSTALPRGFESQVLFVHDSDSTLTFQQSFQHQDDADLKAQVIARIALAAKPTPVPGSTISTTVTPPPPPPGPTPADDARQAWLTAYQHCTALQRGFATGLKTISQQDVSDALAAVNALPYDSSYERLL